MGVSLISFILEARMRWIVSFFYGHETYSQSNIPKNNTTCEDRSNGTYYISKKDQ